MGEREWWRILYYERPKKTLTCKNEESYNYTEFTNMELQVEPTMNTFPTTIRACALRSLVASSTERSYSNFASTTTDKVTTRWVE